MKNKWLHMAYLMEAKKCIDSLLYIKENSNELYNIDLRAEEDSIRQNFYIKLANVLDERFNSSAKKKEICKRDRIVERIYYERDKNSAHKDSSYMPRKYKSINIEISDKKNELNCVKNLCSDILPVQITIDYVPHDKKLFRLVNGVNAKREKQINAVKYPFSYIKFDLSKENSDGNEPFIQRYPIQSVEDIKNMTTREIEKSAVIIDNGMNFYEGLQNRQDSCIKINLLYGSDIWCCINKKELKKIQQLEKVGFLDKFDIPHYEILSDDNKRKLLQKILSE